jgi:hypothetical protein
MFGGRKPSPRMPARHWFEADDGTYFRNCPLIDRERDEVMAWPLLAPGKFAALDALHAEWRETFAAGMQRKAALDPGDVEAVPGTFREAYPRNPGLWVLDEPETA